MHARCKANPRENPDKNYPETLNVEGYDKPDEKIKTDRDGYRVPQKDVDALQDYLLRQKQKDEERRGHN